MTDHRQPDSTAFVLNRRSFLRYAGAGITAATTAGAWLTSSGTAGRAFADAPAGAAPGAWTHADNSPAWPAVGYPVPLPGDAADEARRLATFEVRDELLLPGGFRYDVVAEWGQVFGPKDQPERQVRFGYNCDYTGLVPVDGTPGEYWLLVNHEYISARPWLQGFADVHGPSPVDAEGAAAGLRLHGASLNLLDEAVVQSTPPEAVVAIRRLCEAALGDLGVSVLRVRRTEPGGRFAVVGDSPDHFRVSGAGSQNVPPGSMSFTGPAAALLGTPRGTFANCSGATTPWGTFLTCEENFQD